MAATTEIAWADATFNPWIGCTKIADGCTRCYAAEYAKRYNKAEWGPHGTRVKTSDSYWRQPIKWNREAEAAGERRRVFCASLADAFEDWTGPVLNAKGQRLMWNETHGIGPWQGMGAYARVATLDDLRRDLFALIDQTPHLDWLLLTKRPENVRRMWPLTPGIPSTCVTPDGDYKWDRVTQLMFRPNVWLITSVSDQATSDAAIPELLRLRDLTPVLGLSCEPLLGPVDLRAAGAMLAPTCFCDPHRWETRVCTNADCHQRTGSHGAIDWVIVGGESGHGARPCEVEWIANIREQCESAGVACFVKQLGANVRAHVAGCDGFVWPHGTQLTNEQLDENNHARFSLDDKKGGDWTEWPEDLRVREFPKAVAAAAAGGVL